MGDTWDYGADQAAKAAQEAEDAARAAAEAGGCAAGAAVAGPIGCELGKELGGNLVGDLIDWIKGLFGCEGDAAAAAAYGVFDARILIGLESRADHHVHSHFCGQGDTDAWKLGVRSVIFPIVTEIGMPPISGYCAQNLKEILTVPLPKMNHSERLMADYLFYAGNWSQRPEMGLRCVQPQNMVALGRWLANAQAIYNRKEPPYPADIPDKPGAPTPMSTPVKAGIGIGAALTIAKLAGWL